MSGSKWKRVTGTAAVLAALLGGSGAWAQAQQQGKLRVWFIDVEGGQSTLFVAPDGESLLIDTGWPDNGDRDADRIVAAARQAGIQRIDYVLITHYHTDHVGGLPQLVQKIPVGTVLDHGPNRETADAPTVQGYEAYQKLLAEGKVKHMTLKPGDALPLKQIKATVISADGQLIARPLPGAGQTNPYCAQSEKRPADKTENARSLGILLQYGPVRILDLGDLTWDKEMELMCPVNKLGRVDALVVSHHGWYQSSSPALVDAIHPVVAIMDNGEKKGGSTPTLETLARDPGLKQLWMLHYSDEGGAAHNVTSRYIANLNGPDAGHALEMTVSGHTITVTNTRTGESASYEARQGENGHAAGR
jgi:competence protein ComEC